MQALLALVIVPKAREAWFQAGASLPFAIAGEIAGVVFLLLLPGALLVRSDR